MVKIAEKIFKVNKYEVATVIGDMDQAVEMAKRMIGRGVKVIIARGGIALDLRNALNVPVIDIPVTLQEIARAIIKASEIGKNIAVIGGYSLLNGLKLLNPLLNVDIEQIYIDDTKKIRTELVKLKERGKDVIIGGDITCAIAAELEIRSVILQSSPESILHAYREAETFLSTLLAERRRMEEIRTILDQTKEGYIAVNKKGNITLINKTALRLTRCNVEIPAGKSIKSVFPELENVMDVVSSGKECTQDIAVIGGTNIVYDRIPIKLDDDEVIGAIISFQDINTIREKESSIRRNFYTKGLYAKYTLNDIKGNSRPIKNAIEHAKVFARTDTTVLLIGQTGVGKELFAQGIHNVSNRENGPFVGVNCASLPESILESELFGYEEGAFTGARKSGKVGLFELAHQGTIFLDEVSEIPLALQGRLLRVLQERQIMRLGSDKVIPVDVRIIAATNRNLTDLVAQKKFRDDLFFRLNVLSIHLPTLAERKEDIELLAKNFLKEKAANNQYIITKAAIVALKDYSWPGNVRELQNIMEKLSIISSSGIIDRDDIMMLIRENESLLKIYPAVEKISLRRMELSKEKVLEAIVHANGNRDRAADILRVHRTTLWRWLKKYGI
jgi:transcriptional regulator with PAS, ATPase and Fis domain